MKDQESTQIEYKYQGNEITSKTFAGTKKCIFSLVYSLKLNDTVIAYTSDGIITGTVVLINQKGVSIFWEDKYYFVKWMNVSSRRTIKTKNRL